MPLTPKQLWALPAVRRTREAFRAAEQRFPLREQQASINWGGFAVRFMPMDTADYVQSMTPGDRTEPEDRVVLADPEDIPALKLIFIDIPTLAEFTDRERALGATLQEALHVRDQAVRAWARGWRYGRHCSEQEYDGEPGMTHGSLMWPISEDAFHRAGEHGWTWQGDNELEGVIAAMTYWEVPVRVPILDRSFVLVELAATREVLQLDCDIIRGAP